MKIRYHLTASLLSYGGLSTATRNFNFVNLGASIFGGVAIDQIDHVVYSLVTLHPFSIRRAIEQHNKQMISLTPQFYFLHTLEAFIFSSLLFLQYSWGIFFLSAYFLHLIMDASRYIYFRLKPSWIAKWSLTYTFLNHLMKVIKLK